MEMMAAIAGLRTLKGGCLVSVYSDSQYLVNPMKSGLVYKWRANGWMRNRKDRVLNVDLWDQLLESVTSHDVSFDWMRGHVGHELNERCDRAAVRAAQHPELKRD